MIEIPPRLDERLRSFYEHIEDAVPPSRLTALDTRSRPKSRGLNLVLVSVALTTVAVAVAGFAIELRAHLDHPSPAGSATHANPTPRATAAPTFTPGPLPDVSGNLVANAGFASPQVGAVTSVTSLKGWSVSGTLELVPANTTSEPFFGNQFLVLDGGPVQGEVSQRVKTVPGTNYEVIFTTGDSPRCHGPGLLNLYWNGRLASQTILTPSTQSSAGVGWSTDGYASALATATTTTLSFAGAGQCGASLNQVIVQAYPVPAG